MLTIAMLIALSTGLVLLDVLVDKVLERVL